MSALQAGIGRSDITPAPGTPQGGWGAQIHQRGLDAHMPFYATALVLSNSATTCAVVEVDAIGFDEEWTGKILTAITGLTGLTRQQVRFSCSHTHAGPNTFRLENISQGADMATEYLEGLPNRIAASVWQAQTRLQPARIATSRGTCAINVNRRFRTPEGAMAVGRNWDGNFDPNVRVVRIDDLNQAPVAVLVHYACHPTTLAWDNERFSPDYPGFVRQVVEHQTGATCLFLQGAAGNLTPRRGFVGDLKVCERLGTMLGLEAAKIATEIETVRRCERYVGVMQSGAAIALYTDEPCDSPEPPLSMTTRHIELPAGQFGDPDCLEAESERLRQEVARLRHEHASHEEIRAALAKATQAGWRSKRARRYSGLSSIPLEMQCLRFGDTALLSVPGEPFIEISQAIESNSPFRHTLFSGYSNGGFGYIPTREAFAEGGYEIDATPFGPDAADTLIAEGLRLLREVSSH